MFIKKDIKLCFINNITTFHYQKNAIERGHIFN